MLSDSSVFRFLRARNLKIDKVTLTLTPTRPIILIILIGESNALACSWMATKGLALRLFIDNADDQVITFYHVGESRQHESHIFWRRSCNWENSSSWCKRYSWSVVVFAWLYLVKNNNDIVLGNRPILILDNTVENTKNFEKHMEHLSWNFQRALNKMDGKVEKLVAFLHLGLLW